MLAYHLGRCTGLAMRLVRRSQCAARAHTWLLPSSAHQSALMSPALQGPRLAARCRRAQAAGAAVHSRPVGRGCSSSSSSRAGSPGLRPSCSCPGALGSYRAPVSATHQPQGALRAEHVRDRQPAQACQLDPHEPAWPRPGADHPGEPLPLAAVSHCYVQPLG